MVFRIIGFLLLSSLLGCAKSPEVAGKNGVDTQAMEERNAQLEASIKQFGDSVSSSPPSEHK